MFLAVDIGKDFRPDGDSRLTTKDGDTVKTSSADTTITNQGAMYTSRTSVKETNKELAEANVGGAWITALAVWPQPSRIFAKHTFCPVAEAHNRQAEGIIRCCCEAAREYGVMGAESAWMGDGTRTSMFVDAADDTKGCDPSTKTHVFPDALFDSSSVRIPTLEQCADTCCPDPGSPQAATDQHLAWCVPSFEQRCAAVSVESVGSSSVGSGDVISASSLRRLATDSSETGGMRPGGWRAKVKKAAFSSSDRRSLQRSDLSRGCPFPLLSPFPLLRIGEQGAGTWPATESSSTDDEQESSSSTDDEQETGTGDEQGRESIGTGSSSNLVHGTGR
jgi:hypothetical protein